MYWAQIAVSLAVALFSAYITLRFGDSGVLAAIIGVFAYLLIRWAIAWLYRIRFWYSIDRKDRSRSCPDCSGYIYRQSGDWLLQCKRCGWTEGWPIVRWITHSVPARQLRRTVVGPQLVLVVILAALLVGGALVGVTPSEVDQDLRDFVSSVGDDNQQSPPQEAVGSTATPTQTSSSASSGYDLEAVRAAFLTQLNKERSDQGLQRLSIRSELTRMGESHAANMASHGYVGHEWPDGTTIQDRYRSRGLLPECRLDIRGSDRYYPGAENVASAWIERRFQSSGGSYYVTSEAELGQVLFDIWMNSPPHRRAMLVHSADEMGLGVNVTDRGKVYAALELC